MKLLPCPDDIEEEPGEHEFESSYCVTLVCIGAAKTITPLPGSSAIEPPPSPPSPSPLSLSPPSSPPSAPLGLPPPSPLPAPPEEEGDDVAYGYGEGEVNEAGAAKDAGGDEYGLGEDEGKEDSSGGGGKTGGKAEAAAKKRAEKEARKAAKKQDADAAKAVSAEAKARVAAAKAELKAVKKEAKAEVRTSQKERSASRKALQDKSKGGNKQGAGPPPNLSTRDRERFPRLEAEAERRGMRLPTWGVSAELPGPRARYISDAHSEFPAFRSATRIELTHSILHAALSDGRGAGLDFTQLLASKRVREVIYVHDDDEVSELKRKVRDDGLP